MNEPAPFMTTTPQFDDDAPGEYAPARPTVTRFMLMVPPPSSAAPAAMLNAEWALTAVKLKVRPGAMVIWPELFRVVLGKLPAAWALTVKLPPVMLMSPEFVMVTMRENLAVPPLPVKVP